MSVKSGALAHHYEARGAALEALHRRDREVLLAGPAGTGKSRALLEKLHLMMLASPGARGLIVRKYQRSLGSTALDTWRKAVIPEALAAGLVKFYGGSAEQPAQYVYLNGSVVLVGGLDTTGDQPPKVMSSEYDCLVGGTMVDSPSEIQRAYARPYSGQLVTITTAAGYQLTGTPNHPVFTDRGWVALGQLREGDHVISRVGGQPKVVGRARPDVADQPAPIAEVARALALPSGRGGRTERVETVPMDFHGDGGHGYVDVVTSGRLFQDGGQTSLAEHGVKVQGERGDLQQGALVGDGPAVQTRSARRPAMVPGTVGPAQLRHPLPVGVGVDPALPGDPRALGEVVLPFAVGVPDVSERLALGLGTDAETSRGHLILEATGADANRFSGYRDPEFPFEVAPDRVVHVGVADAGPSRRVYNLQTVDSWYVANEIISHNCIYVQEATELAESDWEALISRLRNWRISFQQLMADCNPGPPTHWLKRRCDVGKTVMLHSKHRDNPRIWNAERGEWTPQGAEYMAGLESLTGVRRLRLLEGQWAAAEGLIFEEFDPLTHVVPRFPVPPEWPRIWGVDFGHTNPMVVQCWARDPDGRLVLYREWYETKQLVEDMARKIMRTVAPGGVVDSEGVYRGGTWIEPRPVAIVCDHDAGDRATLEKHLGMGTTAADKSVGTGIQTMQARLKLPADGKPRLVIFSDALVERDARLWDAKKPTSTVEEFPGYVWAIKPGGELKEEPRKENDHGMDTGRYIVQYEDRYARAGTFYVPGGGA